MRFGLNGERDGDVNTTEQKHQSPAIVLRQAFNKFIVSTENIEWVPESCNSPELIAWRKRYAAEAQQWDRERLIFCG